MSKLFLSRETPWNRTIYVHALVEEGGKRSIGGPVLFHEITDEGVYHPPSLVLRNDEAQNLLDQLWWLGFRPSDGECNEGALAATRRHLEDMRKLAFEAK